MKVLFIAHGRSHDVLDYGYLPLCNNLEQFYKHGIFIDLNAKNGPDFAFDVTDPSNKRRFFNHFDLVFVMAAPSYVLKSKHFWQNVFHWMAPRGMILSILPFYALLLSDTRVLNGKDFNNKIKNWIPRFTKLDPQKWTCDHEHQYVCLRKN